jgi:Family of unknown function (DUF5985)
MAELVYLLCALTSVGCAALLLHGYRQSRARLLLWTSVCFGGLAANNVLLFVDLALAPTLDLSLTRSGIALAAILVLLVGLVWESR